MATEQDMKRRRVNLARLAEPFNLTLTKKPANRSGFKVVRSDETEETEMLDLDKMPTRKRRRAGMSPPRKANLTSPRKVALGSHDLARTKRKDSGLLNLILPSGATKDDAMDVIEHFGLSDDYEIVQNDDGRIVLHRREAGDVEETIPIQLNNGIIAEVDAALLDPMANRKRGDTSMGDGCALARIDFDSRAFSTEKVNKWLDHFGVDYLENGVEAVDGGVIVMRDDDIEEKDCHKIRLAEGVVGYIARADANDIPTRITRAIVNEAFGNFGFGHLDFASALADPEFSNRSESAIFQLSDVLHNIVFRSGLPIGERKELIGRATGQFSTFMGNLMDNLPAVVLDNMKAEQRDDRRNRSAATGTPGGSGDSAGPGGGHMPLMATDGGMNSSFDDSWRQGDSAPPSSEASGDVYSTITGGNTLEREDGSKDASKAGGGNAGLALSLPAARTEKSGDGAAAASGTGASTEGQQAPAADAAGAASGAGGDQAAGTGAATARSGEGTEIGDLVQRAVLAGVKPLGDALGAQQAHFDERLNEIQAKLVKSGENMRRLSRSVKDIEGTVDQIGGESVVRSDGDDQEYVDDTGMDGSEDDGALFSGAFGSNFRDNGRH